MGKELFPKKFNGKNFSWKRLTSNETAQLENELVVRAKWRNDFSASCVRSITCEITTTNRGKICNQCMKLNKFRHIIFMNIT